MFNKKKEEVPKKLPPPIKEVVEATLSNKNNLENKFDMVDKNIENKVEIVEKKEELIKEPQPIQRTFDNIEITKEEKKGLEKKEIDQKNFSKESKEIVKEDLFFSRLIEEILKGNFSEEFLHYDLKEMMKEYHLKKSISHEIIYNSRILELLKTLESLETRWKIKNEEKKVIERELINIEAEIDNLLDELRLITKRLKRLQKLKREVSKDKWFYCINGEVYKDIFELRNALERMDNNTYKYHANEEKNDFAEWIKNVFEEYEIANELLGKNKEEALNILWNI